MLNSLKINLSRDERQSLWPSRWWWLALALLVVCAAVLRYTGYDFSLPYIDHPDEPNFNLAAQAIIDTGSAKLINMQGYPPGIITLNYFLLRYFHDPATPSSSVLGNIRLFSITFSLGSIIVLALLGHRLAAPLAGLIAAFIWALMPSAVEFSRYATPDSAVTFFALLSIYCSILAIHSRSNEWGLAAIYSTMAAILFKYQAIFLIPFVVLLPATRLLISSEYRRDTIKRSVGNVLVLGLFLAWLVLLTPALEATKVPAWVAPTEIMSLPSLTVLWTNLNTILTSLSLPPLLWLPSALGWLLYLRADFRKRLWEFGVLIVVLCSLLWWYGVSIWGEQANRQFILLMAILVLFCAIGLAAWADLLSRVLDKLRPNLLGSRKALASGSVLMVLVLLLDLPHIQASIANSVNHTLPDRRVDLASWMDTSLAPGSYVADETNHKTLNTAWGGVVVQHEYPLYEIAILDTKPIDEWRDSSVEYAILPYWRYQQMQGTVEGREYLAQMTQLKAYPTAHQYRDPGMVVFRLYPIQHETEGSLASVNLIGYDIDQTTLAAGDSLNFTLYWQAEEALGAVYRVYNHLIPLDAREPLIAQIDGAPHYDERRTSMMWDDPAEILISRTFILTLPTDTPPGEYRLVTGFYRPDTGERLLTSDGEDYLLITTLIVSE